MFGIWFRRSFVFLLLIGGCFLTFGIADQQSEIVVGDLDCGDSRRIIIAFSVGEVGGSYFYRVEEHGQVVADSVIDPASHADGQWGGWLSHTGQYKLLQANDGNLAIVVAKDLPLSVVTWHNFATGETMGTAAPDVWRSVYAIAEREGLNVGPAAKLRDRDYLESVKSLNLSHGVFPQSEFERLTDLPNLRRLSLRDADVSDADMKHLSKLEIWRLDLSGTKVTDACVDDLKKCVYLATDSLNVTNTALSRATVNELSIHFDVWSDFSD